MPRLKEPFELADWKDQQVVEFNVLRFEVGDMTIIRRSDGLVKEVTALRVFVRPEDKPIGLPFWDITSKTLRATLEPMLMNPAMKRRRFRVTKHGIAPTARFQVEVLP